MCESEQMYQQCVRSSLHVTCLCAYVCMIAYMCVCLCLCMYVVACVYVWSLMAVRLQVSYRNSMLRAEGEFWDISGSGLRGPSSCP